MLKAAAAPQAASTAQDKASLHVITAVAQTAAETAGCQNALGEGASAVSTAALPTS